MSAVIAFKEKGAQAPVSVEQPYHPAAAAAQPKQQREEQHVIVLYGCRNLPAIQVGGGMLAGWFKLRQIKARLDRLTERSGFACFGSLIERFSHQADHGYTYVRVLGQSAINIHTYPELGSVSALVVTCPGEDEDGSATKRFEKELTAAFQPLSVKAGPAGTVPLVDPYADMENWPVGVN